MKVSLKTCSIKHNCLWCSMCLDLGLATSILQVKGDDEGRRV